MKKTLTIQDIESIVFKTSGQFPRKLKHVKNPHPMMNAIGLTMIDGEYYKWINA